MPDRTAYLLSLASAMCIALCSSCLSTGPTFSANDHAKLQQFQTSLQNNPSHAPRVFYAGVSVAEFDWKYRSLTGWENTSDTLGLALKNWSSVHPQKQRFLRNPTKQQLDTFLNSVKNALQPDDILIVYFGTHQLKNGECLLADKQHMTGKDLATWMATIPNRTLLLADVCYAGKLESSTAWPKTVTRFYSSKPNEEAVGFNLNATRGPIRKYFSSTRLIGRETLNTSITESSLLGLHLLKALASHQMAPDPNLTITTLCDMLVRQQDELVQQATKQTLPQFQYSNPDNHVLIGRDQERALFNALKQLTDTNPSEIALEDGLFLISRIYHPHLKTDHYRQSLDTMVQELKPRLDAATSVNDKITVFTHYLHRDKGLRNVNAPYTEDFLFHKTLDDGKGRCSSFTALYLILGERLGLPLSAGCLPEHIFVQWQNGDKHFNIETTESGTITADDHYRRVRPWTSTPAADVFFMQPLNRRQILATYLSPLGEVMRMRGRFQLAADILNLAIAINPGDAEAWNHLGMTQAASNQLDAARKAYNTALEINPDFAAAWNNMGNISSTLDQRLSNYQKAVALNPELGAAWINLSYTWYAKKNYQMAWTCANRCIQLGMTLKPGYIQTLEKHLDP